MLGLLAELETQSAPGHTSQSLRATECGLTDSRPGTCRKTCSLCLPHPLSPSQPLTSPPPRFAIPPPIAAGFPSPKSPPPFIPERQEVKVREGRLEDLGGIYKGSIGDGGNAHGERTTRGDGALPRDPDRRRKGGAESAGRWGLKSGRGGWARAGAAPTCTGRPQAQVAEVAQAAGLRIRGGFSITTSPAPGARRPRGRARILGSAPGRVKGGGAPSCAGHANASSSGRSSPGRPGGPTQGDPPAPESRRPNPLSSFSPCAVPEFPGAAPASVDPTPPHPGAALHPRPGTHSGAAEGPALHPPATHPPGRGPAAWAREALKRQPAPPLRQAALPRPGGRPMRTRRWR